MGGRWEEPALFCEKLQVAVEAPPPGRPTPAERMDSVRERLQLDAPAKINWYLAVLGRRADGYHELLTLFQTLSLADRVELEASRGIEVRSDLPSLPPGPGNLAYRAAETLARAAAAEGRPVPGVRILLEKRIPVGAGLGGGSSDAAAVLSGCNRLWGLDWPVRRLERLAAELGADVPFFLVGGTAWGRGIGERLEPLPEMPRFWLVLVKPPVSVLTGEVYGRLALSAGKKTLSETAPLVAALERGDARLLGRHLHNDLEEVTARLHPEIRDIQGFLRREGAAGALMSGSGPTVFGLARDEAQARQLAERLKATYGEKGFWVDLVHTTNRSELFRRI